MPVDPRIAAALQYLATVGVTPLHQLPPLAARAAYRAATCDLVTPDRVVPVGSVEPAVVPGGAGDRPARVYRPDGPGPWPTTVFLHGGGFVVGDLDTADQLCRRLCRESGTVVVSVDYRLAPEHPFPAAVEDAVAATRWAARSPEQLGGTDVLAVAGDSAGGNLAAVVARTLPELLSAQLLLYPSTDAAGDYPSRTENGTGYSLDIAHLRWFADHYASGVPGLDPADPRRSPLHAPSLEGLPPAVVVTAECDPLRDEGEAYAAALAAAGVPVDAVRYDGLVHGFVEWTAVTPAAEEAVADILRRFGRLLTAAAEARR